MASVNIPWCGITAALHELKRVVEPWCYLCQRPVHSVTLEQHVQQRCAVRVVLGCHGDHDVAELTMDPFTEEPRGIVDALRGHLEQRLIAFLPEQGADMEHAFNRMGAPRA